MPGRGGSRAVLLLTLALGLRMLLPEQAEALRRGLLDRLCGSEDYGQMVETAGRAFSRQGFREGLIEAFLPMEGENGSGESEERERQAQEDDEDSEESGEEL